MNSEQFSNSSDNIELITPENLYDFIFKKIKEQVIYYWIDSNSDELDSVQHLITKDIANKACISIENKIHTWQQEMYENEKDDFEVFINSYENDHFREYIDFELCNKTIVKFLV